LEKLSVQFLAPHLWRWVFLCLPALALAFWSYYRILAPLTRPARWVLWTLRGAAFLLVLFALWQPVMTAVLRDSGKPGLAILVDHSASMALPAGDGAPGESRAAEAAAVSRSVAKELKDRFRLQWYGFTDRVFPASPDSSDAPGGNTGLGHALEEALTQSNSRPVSGMLVISDGVNTVGRDPVRVAAASPVPIFAVAVGPSEPVSDVEIRRVQTNPTAFAGEPLPVQVILSASGHAGERVRVEVKDRESLLAQQEVQLAGGRGLEQDVTLEVRPSRPGITLLDVDLQGTRDSIPQNDHRQVAVRVLERKTQVLVLAGIPDWDFAFLRRTLGADTTLAYTFLAQVKPGEYRAYGDKKLTRPPSDMAELRDFAAVILLGLGERGLPPATTEAVAQFVRQGGGLLLIGGPERSGGWGALGGLTAVLPGSVGPDLLSSARTLPVVVTLDGQRHPATAVRDNPAETAELWASLPPLWRPAGSLQLRPGAKGLLEYRSGQGEGPPALAASFIERGKSLWLCGTGFWRWGFLPAGSSSANDLYPQFVLGMVRWLAEPAVRDRFQVSPSKLVFQNGESASFTASLWDAAYAPVSGAQISVDVRAERDSSQSAQVVELQGGSDPGHYDGEGAPPAPGAYRFHAVAREGGSGRELGRSEGRFWVETMGPEFARTWTDREQLEEITRKSGGVPAEANALGSLFDQIPRSVRHLGRIREFEVWNHWLLFAAFVSVLSVEWFLRRRRGLA
jgi:hypothetical protein